MVWYWQHTTPHRNITCKKWKKSRTLGGGLGFECLSVSGVRYKEAGDEDPREGALQGKGTQYNGVSKENTGTVVLNKSSTL